MKIGYNLYELFLEIKENFEKRKLTLMSEKEKSFLDENFYQQVCWIRT